MRKLVRDVMTPDPRTVTPETSVVEAARLLEQDDVGSLPVVDATGILVGMITDRDIAVRVVAAGRDPRTTPVGEVASTNVSPAYPDEPLDEALEQMAYRQVRRLPVVDDDRVVGILAQADVVHEVKPKQAGKLVEEISQEPQRLAI
ncbi:MAG TPA: CBS domain-containing protein [Gaiellaceae bacterium]|nr:CBS domain-containing protein [Gaiellaceae bacterium]